jgi:hypothetical protein
MAVIVRLLTNEIMNEPQDDRSRNYKSWIDEMSTIGTLSVSSRDAVAEFLYNLYRNANYTLVDEIGYVIVE